MKTGYTVGEWTLYCVSAPNPAAMTNLNYSFLAVGVEFSGERHLETMGDIEIHLMSYEELKKIVREGGIRQCQMLAPLWKYMAENR